MNIVTDATGLIVMMSETASPTPPAGGTLYALSAQQSAALVPLQAAPNGGIKFDGTTFTVLPFVPPTAFDLSNIDNLDKVLRAIGLMTGRWASKTPAQIKADFLSAYQAIP
jgi:hypothetical protein